MKNYYKKSLLILAAIFLTSIGFAQDYSNGIFILNEGMIGNETASVSFLNGNGDLENNIFSTQNSGMPLGDTGQSIGFTDEFAYIVLNYSNEIKVVNRTTFEFVTSITEQIENPRHIAFYEGNGYVTNWGDSSNPSDDYIAIIDLATNTITGTISVPEGPEVIIEKDGELFVAHIGGYGYGNTVSVIDATTHIINTVAGNETGGGLYKIDLLNLHVVETIPFAATEHPEFLTMDATNLYYVLNANIYKMAKTDTSLPTTSFINTDSNNVQIPYAFSKIDDKLYLGDAVDYVSSGKVFVYGESGVFETVYTVGQLPNGFYKTEAQTANTPHFATVNISMFPNPAYESFSLNISEIAEIVIYDLAGRIVKTATHNNNAISVTDLKAGIYLVHIEVEGKTITQKLIVQ